MIPTWRGSLFAPKSAANGASARRDHPWASEQGTSGGGAAPYRLALFRFAGADQGPQTKAVMAFWPLVPVLKVQV